MESSKTGGRCYFVCDISTIKMTSFLLWRYFFSLYWS